MSTKIWQKMTSAGFLFLGLGMMAGSAHATYSHDCSGGGTNNPSCYTWLYNDVSDLQGTTQKELWGTKSEPSIPAGITATATSWSNTGGGNTILQSAYLGGYGSVGMGVTNKDAGDAGEGISPEHAMDNDYDKDSILFSFGQAVNLTSFNAGYVSGDSDFTVMAYVGDDGVLNNNPNPNGLKYSDLLLHGWMLIGNYYVGGTGQPSSGTGAHDFKNFNNGTTTENNIFSSLWLIGALNTYVSGVQDSKTDYFKILSLAGCDCSTAPAGTPGCGGGKVPEPGTLLLMGAGLLGLTRLNKRRAQA